MTKIGANLFINDNSIVNGPQRIGSSVYIGKNSIVKAFQIYDGVIIGDGCNIGENVIINENVIVIDNSVVPENTLLEREAVYGGDPAKKIIGLRVNRFDVAKYSHSMLFYN
jgi:carbonic anhydrase/acetyltransferase-like protein (isoleucine patch superfamily)